MPHYIINYSIKGCPIKMLYVTELGTFTLRSGSCSSRLRVVLQNYKARHFIIIVSILVIFILWMKYIGCFPMTKLHGAKIIILNGEQRYYDYI